MHLFSRLTPKREKPMLISIVSFLQLCGHENGPQTLAIQILQLFELFELFDLIHLFNRSERPDFQFSIFSFREN